MTPQVQYLTLLAAERVRRDPSRGEEARQRILDELSAMAERFAATAHLYPLTVDDTCPRPNRSPATCLSEELRPPGLKPEAEIWAGALARHTEPRILGERP
jgi:hypothetical protein